MPRPKSSGPTDHELMILKVLWKHSPLSIAEILERFPKKPKPAYSSLLTIVRLMAQKGYIKHEKRGKAFYYEPILKEKSYSRSQVKKLVDSVFGGSKYDLAVNLIKEEKLKPSEIKDLKKLLDNL